MTEGGQFPWKRQVVDLSRGPPADYAALRHPLPQPPAGMVWHQDPQTRDYKLVVPLLLGVEQQLKEKRRYKLQLGTTWNPHTGREVTTLVSVPKAAEQEEEEQQEQEQQQQQANDAETTTNNKTTTEQEEKTLQQQQQQQQQPVAPLLENVDYMVHTVLPSDTLAGLCLRYKVRATTLRQINRFSGTNLAVAPARLIIPLSKNNKKNHHYVVHPQDTSSKEYKLQVVLTEFPHLRAAERAAYLEMNDWDLKATLGEIKADEVWEKQQQQQEKKKRQQLQNNNNNKSIHKNAHKPTSSSSSSHVVVWKQKEDELVCDELTLSSSSSSLTTPLLVQSELEMARTRLK